MKDIRVQIYERHNGQWLDCGYGIMSIRGAVTERVAIECLLGFILDTWLEHPVTDQVPLADIIAGGTFGDLGEIWTNGKGEAQIIDLKGTEQ